MKERKKQGDHKKINKKDQSARFQQQSQQHRRFLPLMSDTLYNCEFCGIGIAVIKIVTTANVEGQFKVCGSCLKEYIDEQVAKK
jgi:transcription elongation factor Elf1